MLLEITKPSWLNLSVKAPNRFQIQLIQSPLPRLAAPSFALRQGKSPY
jgi:hypothetical protein